MQQICIIFWAIFLKIKPFFSGRYLQSISCCCMAIDIKIVIPMYKNHTYTKVTIVPCSKNPSPTFSGALELSSSGVFCLNQGFTLAQAERSTLAVLFGPTFKLQMSGTWSVYISHTYTLWLFNIAMENGHL